MNNFANGSFHSDDAFCALLPQVKAMITYQDVRANNYLLLALNSRQHQRFRMIVAS